MKEKLNIEQLVKLKLENAEVKPSPKAWEKTSRILRRRSFLRFNPGRFNLYYSIALVGILAALTPSIVGIITGEAEKGRPGEISSENKGGSSEAVSTSEMNSDHADANKATSGEDAAKMNEIGQDKQQKQATDYNSDTAELKTYTLDNAPAIDTGIGHEQTESLDVSPLISNFMPSQSEGCVPLTIRFFNTSVEASIYEWDFGIDDMNATDKTRHREPEITFFEPGEYNVTLKAIGEDGNYRMHSEKITVHSKPFADFELDKGGIFNYSNNASDFEWSTLFNTTASEVDSKAAKQLEAKKISSAYQPDLDPADINTDEATHIMLTASNEFGCLDTSIKKLPIPEEPYLEFPNAFTPNPNGSTGGYYNVNEPNNQVFYPFHEEKPASYNLVVYSKSGELVFETNSIDTGWDGYYKESPAKQGVYVYICRGTWNNGDPFVYKGDITVLWAN